MSLRLYNVTLSADLYYVYEDWTTEEIPRCFEVAYGFKWVWA